MVNFKCTISRETCIIKHSPMEKDFLKMHVITGHLDDDDVVLCHTLPIFMGLGQCPIVNQDFAGSVRIFGLDALPVIH